MSLSRAFATTLLAAACSAYAADPADLMITDGTVLTMNPENTVFEHGTVVVSDGKIVAVGGPELTAKYQAKKVLDVKGDIVMPGLINTHTHGSMTVFRSLGDDVPDRLHRYIFPLENKLVSRDMVRTGANLANIEMIKGGVTTYADMYYFEDEVAKTVDKAGLRAVLGETIINFPVADAQTPEEGIRTGLGTDGPMSSNTLTTMNELNLVGKIHKLETKNRAAMPPLTVVEMATKGSARALHMDDKIGSLETGKLADIIVVDTKAPNMVPVYSPYAALVYGANGANVRHTIVDGVILMEDRQLLTVNENEIIQDAQRFAEKVRETVRASGEEVK